MLDDQPGVLESAVIGVPHPDFGESVVGGAGARKPGETPTLDAIMAALGGVAGAVQAAQAPGRAGRIAAQHDGQGAEEHAARPVRGRVRLGQVGWVKPALPRVSLTPTGSASRRRAGSGR